MSTDTTLAAAAERFARLDRYLSGDLTPMATGIATAAKRQAIEVGRAVTGSGRLSHMGRRGVSLRAGYDISDRGRRIVINFRPGGAWVITDTGARPHEEPRLTKRGRRRKGAKGAMFGSGLAHPLTHVEHPGVHGRSSLRIAKRRIEAIVAPEGDKALRAELTKIFGTGG